MAGDAALPARHRHADRPQQRFAELVRAGEDTAEQRAALLEEHDREIDAKVAQLRVEQRRIREKITWYRSASS